MKLVVHLFIVMLAFLQDLHLVSCLNQFDQFFKKLSNNKSLAPKTRQIEDPIVDTTALLCELSNKETSFKSRRERISTILSPDPR